MNFGFHNHEKEFMCLLCQRKFFDPHSLEFHIEYCRRRHPKKVGGEHFTCIVCEETFLELKSLQVHQNIRHFPRDESPSDGPSMQLTTQTRRKKQEKSAQPIEHTCIVCEKTFSDLRRLRLHQRTNHRPFDDSPYFYFTFE